MEIEGVLKRYASEERDRYRSMASKVQEVLSSIMHSADIASHSITSRAKDPESLRDKIVRTGKSYADPLGEITDLAGVRIIAYFPTDVDRIVDLIEREFEIDRENSIDRRKTSDPSVFGYASVHLIAEFTSDRLKLPEYALFRAMKCEVQVRTILQHAWAEIEHDIVYKSTEDIPFELRRRFSSLAGMLEVADREFESLRQDETRVRKRIQDTIGRDNIDIPIDLDSVRFYLEKNHSEEELMPNRVRLLIKLMRSKGLQTIRELDNILTPKALSRADKIVRASIDCSEARECLMRYFVAVGSHFDMPIKEIGLAAECPGLELREDSSERRSGARRIRAGK